MVSGFWPTLLLGVSGGLISEAIRIAGALRTNNPPTKNQLVASLLFTAGVAAATGPERSSAERSTSVIDYLSYRRPS
jgi:hypothetical protein